MKFATPETKKKFLPEKNPYSLLYKPFKSLELRELLKGRLPGRLLNEYHGYSKVLLSRASCSFEYNIN